MKTRTIDKKLAYTLLCVATSESDTKEMLLIDDELLSMLVTSLLRVDVELVSPGSESEYLPEDYRPPMVTNLGVQQGTLDH